MVTLLYALIFALTVGFSLGLVLLRRADYQLFSLLGAMVCLALNWILLGLGYVALLQIVVYVGAIMVIFLFVIMLLNLRKPERFDFGAMTPVQKLGFLFSTLFTVLIAFTAIYFVDWGSTLPAVATDQRQATAGEVAEALITTWLYPFEVISLLLLAAVIAAIMIARTRPVINVDAEAPVERLPEAKERPALEPPSA